MRGLAHKNRAIEAAQVIEELIELAFYDALEVNDSAVRVLGDETLEAIARAEARRAT